MFVRKQITNYYVIQIYM